MYQLARAPGVDRTELFLRTCTSLSSTSENLSLVRSASDLVRNVLNGGDLEPLRVFLSRAESRGTEADDVLAAAGQRVIDEMDDLPRGGLHDVVRRVAQIERDVLSAGGHRSLDGTVRTALAG